MLNFDRHHSGAISLSATIRITPYNGGCAGCGIVLVWVRLASILCDVGQVSDLVHETGLLIVLTAKCYHEI